MPPAPPDCPACRVPLRRPAGPGPGPYRCPACAGTLEGFSPFRAGLAEGAAQRLWVACAGGAAGDPCPYCNRPLRIPVDADAPPGLGICRGCEQVWIPASALGWVTGHAAPGRPAGPPPAAASAPPADCPNCGAPAETDPEGRCRYCRVQITAPPPPVIIFEQPAAPAGRGGFWGLLDRPL